MVHEKRKEGRVKTAQVRGEERGRRFLDEILRVWEGAKAVGCVSVRGLPRAPWRPRQMLFSFFFYLGLRPLPAQPCWVHLFPGQ